MKKFNKKGQVMSTLAQLGVSVLALAIVIVVAFLIMSEATDQIGSIEGVTCTGNSSLVSGGGGTSLACNSTQVLQSAVSIIPDWMSIIVIAVIGAALIGLVGLFRRGR